MAAISYNTLCYGIIHLWQTSVSLKDERIKKMLIRTQDKKTIVNLNNIDLIEIYKDHREKFVIQAEFNDGQIMLGEYTSETQANYILDAIESEYLKVTAGRNGLNQTPVVYHMPEDWEDIKEIKTW